VAGIRYVDKTPAGRRVELERFRVSSELDVADFRSFLRIDDCEPTAAVADNDIAGARINADIVSVVAQREAAGGREVFAAEKPHRTIAGARDNHEIRFLNIANALRLVEPRDLLDPSPACKIHDIEGAVTERRHQQTLAGWVDGHVIDPPGDAG